MVKPLRSIVAQMQNRESRLKACEQQMSNLTDLFKELVRTTQDRNGAPLLSEEQTGVPELSQSAVNEQELGTASKSAGQ
jgi:t-SNARE complex subunit (syntaxin)